MKLISRILTLLLAALVPLAMISCKSGGEQKPAATEGTDPGNAPDIYNPGPNPVTLPDDITEATDFETKTWVAVDLTFESETKYNKAGDQLYTDFRGEFTNRATGTKLTIPGFWNSGTEFVLRFAPTEYGVWEFTTYCSGDAELDGKQGTIAANPYRGDLDIYKHGFVTTDGSKHFVYADGTPFFYLGDTHWGMYTEEFNRPGTHAGKTGAESHFKYIVDKRVEQGFTVYQSEPIGTNANLTDGALSSADAKMFSQNDRYYQYIAEKGLVHANAEFFFAGDMNKNVMNDDAYLEAITRYWVARYAAYPVMWTLGQEIDKSFYHERGDQKLYTAETNPWVRVAEYINKYDAYHHPLSGHQENTTYTTVTGAGTKEKVENGGRSAFLSDEVTRRTGHNWWAAQWSPSITKQIDDAVPKDYWASSKVAINYEGRYCYLWTKDFGARAQSWIAMLSGFAGVGYGAVDMWLYMSSYDTNTTSQDGIDVITPKDKATHWGEAVEFESAYQQGYMREFFEQYRWWDLVPDFNDQGHFAPDTVEPEGEAIARPVAYTCATIDSDLYIIYLYSQDQGSGSVRGMAGGATYEAKWFDPVTNTYIAIGDVTADNTDGSDPVWKAPERPEAHDFVLVLIRK